APGTSRTVRIVLDSPVMVRGGDRFVLRSASPLATIGGGVVTDGDAPRRAKPMASLGLSEGDRLRLFARARLLTLVRAHHESRPLDQGAPRQDIRSRLGIEASLFDQLVTDLVAEK